MVTIPYSPIPSTSTGQLPRQVWQRSDIVGPDTFGSNIGSALQVFGNRLEGASDVLAKHAVEIEATERQKDNFNKSADLVKFETDEENRLLEAKRAATGDGKGFTDAFLQGTKERLDKFMQTVNPQERERFNLQRQRVETSLRQKAFNAQLGISDSYHITKVKDTFDVLQKRIQNEPDALDAIRAEGEAAINASALPAETKRELIAGWKSAAVRIYADTEIKRDPARAQEKLGAPPSNFFDRAVIPYEGGTRYDARTRSREGLSSGRDAHGVSQIKPETAIEQAQLMGIKAFEGKSIDEVRTILKTDHELNYRLGKAYYDRAISTLDGSVPAALAWYHAGPAAAKAWHKKAVAQFGKDYTVDQFISVVNPGSNDGNITTQEYIRRVMARGGYTTTDAPATAPGSDKRLSDLTFEARNSLREAADRALKQQQLQLEQYTIRQQAETFNGMKIGVRDGLLGITDIESAIKSGAVPRYEDQQELYNIHKARQKRLEDEAAGNKIIQYGAASPYLKEHRDQVNTAYDGVVGTITDPIKRMELGAAIWQKTKIIPQGAVAEMLGALAGKDAKNLVRTFQLLDQIANASDNADPFGGVTTNKSKLEEAAAFYRSEAGLGKNATEIAQRWAEQESPEYKTKFSGRLKDDEAKKLREKWTKTDESVILQKMFGPGGIMGLIGVGRPEFPSGRVKDVMVDEFATHALRYYNEVAPNEAQAMEYAKAQMKKYWGVTHDQKLMKYPPEMAYGPSFNGDQTWIYKYAADEVGRLTESVPPDWRKLRLVELPRATEDAFNAGPDKRIRALPDGNVIGGVPYAIQYTDDKGVLQTLFRPGTVEPAAWVPDMLRKQREDEFYKKSRLTYARDVIKGPPPEGGVQQPLTRFDMRTGAYAGDPEERAALLNKIQAAKDKQIENIKNTPPMEGGLASILTNFDPRTGDFIGPPDQMDLLHDRIIKTKELNEKEKAELFRKMQEAIDGTRPGVSAVPSPLTNFDPATGLFKGRQ